jgi:hypothetical protein
MSYEPPLDDPWSLDTEEQEVEPLEDRMWDEITEVDNDYINDTAFVTTDPTPSFIPTDSSPPF